MTDLNELLERVKKATGPDRQLDYALFCHFAPMEVASAWHPLNGHKYTTSIDSALGLVERVLPGWKWNIGHDANDDLHATVWHGVTEHDEYGSIAPLAILAALLSALISKESRS